jgi:myo-inositol 2-dehydrogenase/D-chiro-inositol 1-dehydrogenase
MKPERPLRFGLIGTGCIGRLHAEHLATRVRGARLAAVADINLAAAREVATRFNVETATDDYRRLLEDRSLDAVVICSTTDTHTPFIQAAAAHGKHIFCEKPIGLDLKRIQDALEAVDKAGVKLQVGFNRRFDPSFAKAREMIAAGKIGQPHILRITSRDPEPPPLEYVKSSGGIFLDMTIHDFDMVRFLSGSEVEEIYAMGGAFVLPEIARLGEVDTCVLTLRLKNSVLATIDNSLQAVYGYDQRVEVFGSGGMVMVSNRTPENHVCVDREGVHSAKPQYFFLERYQDSYLAEMQSFVESIQEDRVPLVTGQDGLAPVLIGFAARKSLQEGKPVKLSRFVL